MFVTRRWEVWQECRKFCVPFCHIGICFLGTISSWYRNMWRRAPWAPLTTSSCTTAPTSSPIIYSSWHTNVAICITIGRAPSEFPHRAKWVYLDPVFLLVPHCWAALEMIWPYVTHRTWYTIISYVIKRQKYLLWVVCCDLWLDRSKIDWKLLFQAANFNILCWYLITENSLNHQ